MKVTAASLSRKLQKWQQQLNAPQSQVLLYPAEWEPSRVEAYCIAEKVAKDAFRFPCYSLNQPYIRTLIG